MSYEYFFLISNGSEAIYQDNTRAEFRNNLAKPLRVNSNSIKLAIDTIIFDNTFAVYSSEAEADIILFLNNEYYILNLSGTKSLSSMVRRINKFFVDIAYSLQLNEVIGKTTLSNGKINLELRIGDVAALPELCEFLAFEGDYDYQNFEYGEEIVPYFRLRRKNDQTKIYQSKEEIRLNDFTPEYVNIICENISAYPRNSLMQNIICSIPLNTYQPTIFYSPTFRSFHTTNTNNLSTVKITFQQPSGRKLYFKDGSPNIIKMAASNSKSLDSFYVQATSSKSSTFPDNTNNAFQVELPKEYRLDGKWQVGVTNVFFPKPTNIIKFDTSIFTIPEGQNYFFACFSNPITRKKYMKFPLLEFSKKELAIFLVRHFSEFFAVYLDQNEDIFLTMRKEFEGGGGGQIQILTSKTILEIINSQNHLNKMNAASLTVIFKERLKTEFAQFNADRMKNDFLEGFIINKTFTTIKESIPKSNFFFSVRSFYNLTDITEIDITRIDTRRIISLTENEFLKKEEIRLIQEVQNQQDFKSTHELLPSFFFIYCDFVTETVMADRFVNLLKMVPFRSGFNNLPGGLFDFPRCEFFDVNKQYLKNLKFEIRTHSGKEYLYFPSNEDIIITMKFQKV